ncbi:MAG: MoaD/ThiS family protein [Verrucomicrobiota bacterium]
MKVRVLAFSEAKSLLGFSEREISCSRGDTPRFVLEKINSNVEDYLNSWRVAINHEYADWDQELDGYVELAVIPPVSGG